MKPIIFSIALGLLTATGFAKIISIPTDYTTIQEGINHAQDGDVIKVLPGTYYENLVVDGKNNIGIVSEYFYTGDTAMISATVINGTKIQQPTVTVKNVANEFGIYGLSITGGNSSQNDMVSAGIFCDSIKGTIKIRHCHIYGVESADPGKTAVGGIVIRKSTSEIGNCRIHNNGYSGFGSVPFSGGIIILNDSTIKWLHTSIHGNKISDCYNGTGNKYIDGSVAIAVVNAHSSITNNVINGVGSTGIYLSNCVETCIKHNTIYFNDLLHGILVKNSLNVTAVNNIIWSDWVSDALSGVFYSLKLADTTSTVFVSHNNIKGGFGDSTVFSANGNIDADPQFVNVSVGNYHLSATSPCIDAGATSYNDWLWFSETCTDFLSADTDFSLADMGALPFDQGQVSCTDITLVDIDIINDTLVVTVQNHSTRSFYNTQIKYVVMDGDTILLYQSFFWAKPLLKKALQTYKYPKPSSIMGNIASMQILFSYNGGVDVCALSQSTFCDSLEILEVGFDSSLTHLNVRISNNSSQKLIHPYVAFILEPNGDTVANGVSNLFQQQANTLQEYQAKSVTASFEEGIYTIGFIRNTIMGKQDTCLLTYLYYSDVCSQLTLTEIKVGLQPSVSIAFAGNATDVLGYPHVDYILNSVGDTVADGLFFSLFGQRGNSEAIYTDFTQVKPFSGELRVVFKFTGKSTDWDSCVFNVNWDTLKTSISTELMDAHEVTTFPNPSEGFVTVDASNISIAEITLLNVAGQNVYRETVSSPVHLLQMGNLNKGIYIIEVVLSDNTVVHKKLMLH